MPLLDTSEKNFEASIEAHLLNTNGYEQRTSTDYDASLCLIPNDVIRFVQATQPEKWNQLSKVYGENARTRFLNRLAEQITKRGTLDVLRKGIKDVGAHIDMMYLRPRTSLNESSQRLYQANVFSVVRQLYFSQQNRKSLDLVLFINGLPIFTAELKNPFKGQKVWNAIHQYKNDRDPREPLFVFGRCLIHYAVDPDLVYMTSHLRKEKTFFLPFNQGRDYGAGNPPNPFGFATSYLWEQIWTKDSVLNLLEQFIHIIDVEDDKGQKTGERRIIIPRYHQLDAVQRLVADALAYGAGRRYLIQHSAGSGKTFSIAWLAHQLSDLHNASNERIFDSVIVITDRRILDRQLQQTLRQFEQVSGVVENIDKTARQLKEAIEAGKRIIVTTLQKFPMIVRETGEIPGKRFAIIIDEAHSSQGGESVKSVRQVLRQLEDGDDVWDEEQDEAPMPDAQDIIEEELRSRKHQPNISTFAFTATPKPRTLELFGSMCPDGRYEAFSLYSMRQAIDEGFILDVLKNYTTYKSYWRLLKTVQDDPQYESGKAKAMIRRFVELNAQTINEKIAVMVEHFHAQVSHQINHTAKAMIVTRSRLHAIRYFLALRAYLQRQGYPYKALVAFSGTIKDSIETYTESGLNGFPESQTAEIFKGNEYRFLVVADKFQTGFDQPLLHTMYVDKKLGGVHAVQTLSRLNRTHPGKEETLVLDFSNEAEHIQAAFAPYYTRTMLSESTDPNLLYDRETELKSFGLFDDDNVENFAALYFDPRTTQDKLHAPLDPVVVRFKELTVEEQHAFRSKLNDYIRQYAFLAQILPFEDTGLEKLYVFAKLLYRKLPIERDQMPTEILASIDLESYRLRQTSSRRIQLEQKIAVLDPMIGANSALRPDDPKETLSAIIQELNDRFGMNLSETDAATLQQVHALVVESKIVQDSLKVNSPDKARLTYREALMDGMQDIHASNFNLYRKMNDSESFRYYVADRLFEYFLNSQQNK